MIRSITQASMSVQISNGTYSQPCFTTTTSAPVYNGGAQFFAGQMRYDLANNRMLVFDGYNWVSLVAAHANIGLTAEAEQAIAWATKKQKEEQELEHLLKRSPALRDAYEKFQIVKALVNDDTRQPA